MWFPKKKKTFLASNTLSRIFPFEERRRREVKPVWLKKPWRGVVTVIYIYSLPRHLGGCYPGGLCWSSQKLLTPFSQLWVSIDTAWLWFSHIEVVSHVLLTVKTGWVDAGTWMPSGIKHYYTSETLLDQKELSLPKVLNSQKRFESEEDKCRKSMVLQNCIFFLQISKRITSCIPVTFIVNFS